MPPPVISHWRCALSASNAGSITENASPSLDARSAPLSSPAKNSVLRHSCTTRSKVRPASAETWALGGTARLSTYLRLSSALSFSDRCLRMRRTARFLMGGIKRRVLAVCSFESGEGRWKIALREPDHAHVVMGSRRAARRRKKFKRVRSLT